MNDLVRLITDDDCDPKNDADVWNLVDPSNEQGPAALCTQEFFGLGESNCEYETKQAKRGGITCPECLRKLKLLKEVKL